jgi:glycosyltransferase involved in cell wall biosynthesis
VTRVLIEVSDTFFSGLKTGIQVVTDQLVSGLHKEKNVDLIISSYGGKAKIFHIDHADYLYHRNSRRRIYLRKIYTTLTNYSFLKNFRFILGPYKKYRNVSNNLKYRNKEIKIELIKEDSDTYLFLPDAFWNNGSHSLKIVQASRNKGIHVIIFVHDVLPITHPEFFTTRAVEIFTRYFSQIAALSDTLIFSSNSVRNDFERNFPEISSKKVVVPLEVFPRFSTQNRPQSIPADLEFALAIGTLEPRKNYSLILDAFSQADSNLKLVIVGRLGWMSNEITARLSLMEDKVFWLPDPTDSQIAWLIANANFGICASFAEGFGLPLREFLENGLPVVASDISIFREIDAKYGNSVVYFDPGSLSDLRLALIKVSSLEKFDRQDVNSSKSANFIKKIASIFVQQ